MINQNVKNAQSVEVTGSNILTNSVRGLECVPNVGKSGGQILITQNLSTHHQKVDTGQFEAIINVR